MAELTDTRAGGISANDVGALLAHLSRLLGDERSVYMYPLKRRTVVEIVRYLTAFHALLREEE